MHTCISSPWLLPNPVVLSNHYRELLHFILRSTRNKDEAADLTQESYARVLSMQQRGGVIRDARALLYQTARNLLIDRHRQTKQDSLPTGRDLLDAEADAPMPAEEPLAPEAFEPETAEASRQTVQALLTAIQSLPPRCREAFILFKFDGLSQAEVAERMNISVKMVEKHIRNGMWACRDCLDQIDSTASASREERSQ